MNLPTVIPASSQFQHRSSWQLPPTELDNCSPPPSKRPLRRDSPLRLFNIPCNWSTDSLVTTWLASVGSDNRTRRHRRRQSDSQLHYNGEPPATLSLEEPTKKTRSEPVTSPLRQDYAGAPPSGYTRSIADLDTGTARSIGTTKTTGISLVGDAGYRKLNLASNEISYRFRHEKLPENITRLHEMACKERDSPEPTTEEVWADNRLELMSRGEPEPAVEKYFGRYILPEPEESEVLSRTNRVQYFRHNVPHAHGSQYRVSQSIPDILYGYDSGAFAQYGPAQVEKGKANSAGLQFPFFAIEFKGDGPAGMGSLWVATNQCLSGSATCTNIADRLNQQLIALKGAETPTFDNAAFSIAMNGNDARLYISWKDSELKYYMQQLNSFSLFRPSDYISFRRHVRNIVDWGRDSRLRAIQSSLDTLLEDNRGLASEVAKSRPPPSETGSSSSRGGKRLKHSKDCYQY